MVTGFAVPRSHFWARRPPGRTALPVTILCQSGSMRKAVCGLLVLLSWPVWAQQGVHPATGRRYAGVMGPAGADWLVRPEREAEEQPDAALDAIGIVKGSSVADVGAGAGYMTWRLAERVGSGGKVYEIGRAACRERV